MDKEKPMWKKILAFILIVGLCLFVGNLILLGLAMAAGLSIEDGSEIFNAVADPSMRPFIKTGIGLNHLLIFTGSALLFAFWLKRKEWKSYFETRGLDFGLLGSLVMLLFCAFPIIGASATVFEGVEWATEFDESSLDALMKMLQMDSVFDLVINLIIVALLPAIGEELLFRGVIQKELVGKIKDHHIAIIIASIIFSGIHLQIQGFLPKLLIGLILGYAYYWTKSIWYPMILHFIVNGSQIFILYFVGDQIENIEEKAIEPEKWVLFMVVIFSCFLCYLIIRSIQKQIEEKQEDNV